MQRYEIDLMDYVQKRQKLDASQYQALWNDLSSALHHLHSRQIVHRDIKPENILVDGQHFVLCDFDLAQSSKSPLMFVAGSESYLAPEFWTMKHHDLASGDMTMKGCDLVPGDIWSAGVTLLAVATGRRPWARATQQDTFFSDFMGMSTDVYVCDMLKRFTGDAFRLHTKHLVCTLTHMLHMRPDCRPSAAGMRMVTSSFCL